MILQALYKLAIEEKLVDDPDFEFRPVPWLVVVEAGGKAARIIPTRSGPALGKGADRGRVFRIPRQAASRSGIKPPPEFFTDNARFVFGIGTADKVIASAADSAKAKARSESFLHVVERCAAATADEGAIAVKTFLELVHSGAATVTLDPGTLSNDLFAFVYAPDEDRRVTDRPKVEAYWRGVRANSANGPLRLCLVSGHPSPPTEKHPMLKSLPGANTSGAALVSFNSSAFESYGWKRHENATVSTAVAEACGTAMNRLLSPAFPDPCERGQTLPRRNIRLSNDTVLCYWTAGGKHNEFCSIFDALLQANPERVGEVYRSIWKGRAVAMDDPTPFYALTISGAQGRAAVRDWIESTVGRVSRNIAAHFRDIDILRNTPKPKTRALPPQMSLTDLLAATVPDGSAAPGPLVRQVVESVFEGYVYPIGLLQQAILRERAEAGRNEWLDHARRDARAAIIKAVLNRRKRFHLDTTNYKEIETAMDPTNSSEGYTLGRLMAVLERLQQAALGSVNASLVDRYFSGASATPKAAFVRLLRNARHHVSKARDEPQSGGMAFLLDRLIDDLAGRFDPESNGFPAHLDLEQQGLFILGYHQMRHWLWMSNEERESWESEHPGAPRAYMWKASQRAAAE